MFATLFVISGIIGIFAYKANQLQNQTSAISVVKIQLEKKNEIFDLQVEKRDLEVKIAQIQERIEAIEKEVEKALNEHKKQRKNETIKSGK